MAFDPIADGEAAVSVRAKLNGALEQAKPEASSAESLGSSSDVLMTPAAASNRFDQEAGMPLSDEEFRYAPVVGPDGNPPFGIRHDGTVYINPDNAFSDSEWQWAMVDENGVVLLGQRWGETQAVLGPIYGALADRSYIEGAAPNRRAVVITGSRAVPITFGEVDPVDVAIVGSEAQYHTVSGSVATLLREDLVAAAALATGVTKIVLVLVLGQSLGAGVLSSPALTTTADATSRVVMFSGGIRALGTGQTSVDLNSVLTKDRLLALVAEAEVAQESPAAQLARVLSAGLASNIGVLVSNHAIGGQPYSAIKKGTQPYANALTAVRRAAIIAGLRELDLEVVAHVIHGENDRAAAAGVYRGYLEEWQSDLTDDVQNIVAGHGEVLFYVSQLANWTDYGDATSAVPQDIAAAADANPGKIVLVGSRYLGTTVDGIHLDNTSSAELGDIHAMAELRQRASSPPCLRALPWTRSGATITLPLDVPTLPVVLDTSRVSNPGNYGLVYEQTGGTPATISGVSVSGSDLTITLDTDPGAPSAEYLRIAIDGTAGADGGPTTGPRTCVRDSTVGSTVHGARARHCYLAMGRVPKAP